MSGNGMRTFVARAGVAFPYNVRIERALPTGGGTSSGGSNSRRMCFHPRAGGGVRSICASAANGAMWCAPRMPQLSKKFSRTTHMKTVCSTASERSVSRWLGASQAVQRDVCGRLVDCNCNPDSTKPDAAPEWQGGNRSNTSGIARISNAAMRDAATGDCFPDCCYSPHESSRSGLAVSLAEDPS